MFLQAYSFTYAAARRFMGQARICPALGRCFRQRQDGPWCILSVRFQRERDDCFNRGHGTMPTYMMRLAPPLFVWAVEDLNL